MNPKLLKFLLDAGVLIGAAFFLYGLFLIWHPLAPLVGGLILSGVCLFVAYGQERKAAIDRIRNGGR